MKPVGNFVHLPLPASLRADVPRNADDYLRRSSIHTIKSTATRFVSLLSSHRCSGGTSLAYDRWDTCQHW